MVSMIMNHLSTPVIVNSAFAIFAIIIIVKLILVLKNDRGRTIYNLEQDVPLEVLADLWRKGKLSSVEISIEKLVPVWKEVIDDDETDSLELRHERARIFWQRISHYFKRLPIHREVCAHLLTILDQEGDCPSVVNVLKFRRDTESSWDSNTYSLLGMTTLFDHSINVAERIIELLVDIEAQHVIPDGLIAALAHDLGKIPSLHGQLYSTGDHPIAAGATLAAINQFQELPDKDREEISKAVKHHHKTLDNLLAQNLRRADQQARQREMDWATAELAHNQWGRTSNQPALLSHEATANVTPVPGRQSAPSAVVDVPEEPATDANDRYHDADESVLVQNALDVTPLRDGLAGGPLSLEDKADKAESQSEFSPPTMNDLFSGTPSSDQLFGGADDDVPEAIPVNAAPSPVDIPIPVQSSQPMADTAALQSPPPPFPDHQPRPGDPGKAWRTQSDLYGDGGDKSKNSTDVRKPILVAVPGWFNADEYIRRLKPHINKTDGRRYFVFSMPDGIVYFQTGVIQAELRKLASENGDSTLATIEPDDPAMKDIIFTIIYELRQKDFIEESLIGRDYYGGWFFVNYRSGNRQRGYYTPFRAEAFGMPSELEALKIKLGSATTLDFISVVPDTTQGGNTNDKKW